MDSLGKSFQRSQRATLRGSRAKYRGLLEAERDAAADRAEFLRRSATASGALRSIWETTRLEEFLLVADAREKGYEAARDVRVVVDGAPHVVSQGRVVPLGDGRVDWPRLSAALPIPRRPRWTYEMPPEELDAAERRAFLAWRRDLSRLEELHRAVLSPYEKNLEVWRQLWRVVERADLVLFILDARNPLGFRCADFERYVRGTGSETNTTEAEQQQQQKPKDIIYLLNKADLLTVGQRRAWAAYFEARGESFVFFSARPAATKSSDESPQDEGREGEGIDADHTDNENEEEEEEEEEEEGEEEETETEETLMQKKKRRCGRKALRAPIALAHPYELTQRLRRGAATAAATVGPTRSSLPSQCSPLSSQQQQQQKPCRPPTADEAARDARAALGSLSLRDPSSIAGPTELLDIFVARRGTASLDSAAPPLLVGLVGYPNVGKSSTINALLGTKRVVVSATPGKTRHLQTLLIPRERRVALCDCPGLVFPSLASTRAHLLCDGVLPVDTSADAAAAVAVICRRVPRAVLERRLRVDLSAVEEEEATRGGTGGGTRTTTARAEHLLSAVAQGRGYLGAHGRPDRGRAARDVLRLYVEGAIAYAEPPPGHVEHTARNQDPRHKGEEEQEKEKEHKQQEEKVQEEQEEGIDEEEGDDWEDMEDAEAWDDLESAAGARALSDAGDVASEPNGAPRGQRVDPPLFFDRARGPMTREEAFNAEANMACMAVVKEAPKRHRRTNHQLEVDYETFINDEGEVELRIDDDDGILQLDRPATTQPRGAKEDNKKRMSKRQMRREEKRNGGAGHGNPTSRRVGVIGYNSL